MTTEEKLTKAVYLLGMALSAIKSVYWTNELKSDDFCIQYLIDTQETIEKGINELFYGNKEEK